MMSPVLLPLVHAIATAMSAIAAIGSPLRNPVALSMAMLMLPTACYFSIPRRLHRYTYPPSLPYQRLRLQTTIEHRQSGMVTCCAGESEEGRLGDSSPYGSCRCGPSRTDDVFLLKEVLTLLTSNKAISARQGECR
jgi:hypothetical protein